LTGNFVWVRNFGANPSLPTSGTRVDVYADRTALSQYFYGYDFAIAGAGSLSGNLSIGAGLYAGPIYIHSTTPRPLGTGVIQQAQSNETRGKSAWLDLPLCGSTNGAFVVHEIAYGVDGALTKLAADFSAACSYGYQTNATGAIRFGSSYPASIDQTFAVAGADHTVTEGDQIVLDGTLSWNPSRRVTSLTWAQVSGPAIDLSSCAAGVCRTFAPLVPKGGSQVVLLLTASSDSGQAATQELRLTIRSWKDRQSRVDVFGNGYVAGGANIHFTPDDGAFDIPVKRGSESVYPSQTPERIELGFFGNATYGPAPVVPPNLVISNVSGSALIPGPYSGFLLAGFAPGSQPGLDASFNGHGCSSPDWVASIAALDRDPLELTRVSRAAMFVDVICTEGAGDESSFMRFWIDYEPQNPPTAVASGPAQVAPGSSFELHDAGSQTPAGPALTRYWRQVFGTPARSLSMTPSGSLVVDPDPLTPIGSELVFAYSIVDALGQGSVDLVRVTIGARMAATSERVKQANAPSVVALGKGDAAGARYAKRRR
jgi:hypothetical protein